MGYTIRQIPPDHKFCQDLSLDALTCVISPEVAHAVVTETGTQATRERKLTAEATIWVLIAMTLYAHLALGDVVRKVAQGLRFIWPDPTIAVAGAPALVYRRYQVGERPLQALFARVARPLATPATVGAFRYGLRLMAIDGTVEDAPDSPANAAAFGRQRGSRGDSAFPQVRGVYLVECATHAIVDAVFGPYALGERVGALALLHSLTRGMLVLWDGGFHSYDLRAATRGRGAHVLARLPARVVPQVIRPLSDGSTLAYLRAPRGSPRTHLLVRVITYTLTDPARPGYGEVHRVITTLLNPVLAPATDLVNLYHERWEIELTIDEVDTHQRLAGRPLRSRKPEGVRQELYALLLAHYAVRALMHEAALRDGLDPDRLSFVHALRVITDAVPEFQMIAPHLLPLLYARLLADSAAVRLPPRRNRTNPRVVKRKMSKFALKRVHHAERPPLTRSFADAVSLI